MIDLPSKIEKGPAPKPEPKAKKEPYRIRRVSPKKAKEIAETQKFFDGYLEGHPTGRCFECEEIIAFPDGYNVCHLRSAGASRKVKEYRDSKGVVLACVPCHKRYDESKNTAKTKIYQLAQEVIPEQKFKYNGYNRY